VKKLTFRKRLKNLEDKCSFRRQSVELEPDLLLKELADQHRSLEALSIEELQKVINDVRTQPANSDNDNDPLKEYAEELKEALILDLEAILQQKKSPDRLIRDPENDCI
jgi:hypothetical protein